MSNILPLEQHTAAPEMTPTLSFLDPSPPPTPEPEPGWLYGLVETYEDPCESRCDDPWFDLPEDFGFYHPWKWDSSGLSHGALRCCPEVRMEIGELWPGPEPATEEKYDQLQSFGDWVDLTAFAAGL